MGFASMSNVRLTSCDTHYSNSRDRLCWHFDQRYGGYRCGNTKSLNNSNQWKKLVMIGNGLEGGNQIAVASGQYRSSGCSGTRDSVCSACRECNAGQFRSRDCSATQNAVCTTCKRCKSGQYNLGGCEGRSDSICANCSRCDAGE